MKCLVVDDSATMRRLFRNALTALGHAEILEASDGRQALGRCDGAVGLVVSGWNLTGMSGLELVRKLRAQPATSGVKILLVSSRNQKVDVMAAAESGIDAYVLRPFTSEVLRQKLEVVMQKGGPAPSGDEGEPTARAA